MLSHNSTRLVSPAAPVVLQRPVASGIFTPLINDSLYPMSCARSAQDETDLLTSSSDEMESSQQPSDCLHSD
jgi:hypothetical protein